MIDFFDFADIATLPSLASMKKSAQSAAAAHYAMIRIVLIFALTINHTLTLSYAIGFFLHIHPSSLAAQQR